MANNHKLINALYSIVYRTPLLSHILHKMTMHRIKTKVEGHQTMHFLFLCKGNICRSCFAAELLKTKAIEKDFSISSAGVDTTPGKPADSTAVVVAKKYNVHLEDHRTQSLKNIEAEASIIFVMEPWQKSAAIKMFPASQPSVFLLGSLLTPSRAVIKDPFGKSEKDFITCFSEIEEAINTLLNILNEPNE